LDENINILIGPNGGGKTNLLDSITLVLKKYFIIPWTSQAHNQHINPRNRIYRIDETIQHHHLEKNRLRKHEPQKIEVTIQVSEDDISNVRSMQMFLQKLPNYGDHELAAHSLPSNTNELPLVQNLVDKMEFNYVIVDGVFTNLTVESSRFLHYLNRYELYKQLLSQYQGDDLVQPFIFLPTNRIQNQLTTQFQLSGMEQHQLRRGSELSHSRMQVSFSQLALQNLVRIYREMEARNFRISTHGKSGYELFRQNKIIESISDHLKKLGFDWDLSCTQIFNNSFDLTLKKSGVEFYAQEASSGEREIISYIITIFGLNVRNALVIVDEPELHLHPKWQKLVFRLFKTLSIETGNQFLLTTHSPFFVSEESIRYVSRVSMRNMTSEINSSSGHQLPDVKHLISTVNSQNNEKM
jgi:putative ATP-dependent endonuclease of OLD family